MTIQIIHTLLSNQLSSWSLRSHVLGLEVKESLCESFLECFGPRGYAFHPTLFKASPTQPLVGMEQTCASNEFSGLVDFQHNREIDNREIDSTIVVSPTLACPSPLTKQFYDWCTDHHQEIWNALIFCWARSNLLVGYPFSVMQVASQHSIICHVRQVSPSVMIGDPFRECSHSSSYNFFQFKSQNVCLG